MSHGILFGRARGTWASDDRLELEFDAAEDLGLPTGMVALDELVDGRAEDALAGLPPGRGRVWVYRGWLINPTEYADLYEAVLGRGDSMAVNPEEFAAASCVPNWAPILDDRTPPTIWTDDTDAEEAWELALEAFGPPPWIIKDHVKSAKERWATACYVPPNCTPEGFAAICEGLIDARGDRFEGGIVVRKYLQLREIPYATATGPAHDEHRLVFWQGRIVANTPYFDSENRPIRASDFDWLGEAIESPFFVADIARLAAGGATVIEINDGGCATMADQVDTRTMYRRMFGHRR